LRNGQGSLGEAGTLGRQPATSVVAPRSRPHDEARDTSKIRSDLASLAGGDRNRRPTRRPALRRRACAPNDKSGTRDCPSSSDGTLFIGTNHSQATSAQSPVQGDWLFKAGIKCPPESKSDSLARFGRLGVPWYPVHSGIPAMRSPLTNLSKSSGRRRWESSRA
jgi:hypothetical protein